MVRLLIYISLGLAIGVAASWAHWHRRPSDAGIRTRVLEGQIAAAPKGVAAVLGDSLVEQAYIPTLCGREGLNAGVSGASSRDVIQVAKTLHDAGTDVKAVGVGTNDAIQERSPTDFSRDLNTLLRLTKPAALIGISSIPGHVNAASAINSVIISTARSHQLTYIPAITDRALFSSDAVHLNREGRREWVQRLMRACLP